MRGVYNEAANQLKVYEGNSLIFHTDEIAGYAHDQYFALNEYEEFILNLDTPSLDLYDSGGGHIKKLKLKIE